MKKVGTLFLACLTIVSLQVSATPMLFTLHYCGGELMELGVNDPISPCCPEEPNRGETNIKTSCCTFEIHSFENHDHATKTNRQTVIDLEIAVPEPTPFYSALITFERLVSTINANAPPQPTGKDLCIQFERFLL